nr:unnamed protein product [Callosobruchus chinensis]
METELFHRALLRHDKDFRRVAQEMKSKTAKQCVQFYYVWKKVCSDEYKRLKVVRERKHTILRSTETDMAMEEKLYLDAKLLGFADSGSPMPVPSETRSFVCEYPDCSASFNSRAALNGHIRIHGGTARNSPTPSTSLQDRRTAPHHHHHHHHPAHSTAVVTSSSAGGAGGSASCHPDSTEEYPCKICGK